MARTLPSLLILFSVAGTVAAEAPDDSRLALRTAEALYSGVRTATLDNGLRVYLKPLAGSPVVTTMVAYKVGSADEDLDSTGLSHYLEHLMFKGTEKLRPGDIDRITFRNGGVNNAYTTEDCTIFHFDFPANRWEAALDVEADRMRNLRIDAAHEFRQEKGAVTSELERNEDTPWDLENKAILPLLFGKKAPYGHPVIGEKQHVLDATAEIIKGHYDRWYHPNNASLVVAGGIDPDKALAAIRHRFESIPAAKLPARKAAVEVLNRSKPIKRQMASKFAVARLLLGWNTVKSTDPDYPVLAMIEGLLAGGKTSRLYRGLVESAQVALSVSASNSGGRYPGWFSVQVEVAPGKDRAKVEKLALAEIQHLIDEPPSEKELKRVQRGTLASTVFGRESAHGLADSIAQAVTIADLDWLKGYLPAVLAVTPADVQRVARKYLAPTQRVQIWSLPAMGDKGEPKDSPPAKPGRRAARPAPGGFSLDSARRVELPNGLVLLLYEDHRLPLFVAEAEVQDVRLREPAAQAGLAALVGSLLDEGTATQSGQQIAEAIEDVGGTLSMSGAGGSVRVLAPDRKLGLALLLECLSKPAFPAEAFDRIKEQQLGEIEDTATQPDARARDAFQALVYGKHPLGRPRQGTLKTVRPLTREDCVAFHQKVFVPNNLILVVVGDFNSAEIIDEVTRRTRDWKKGELPPLDLARPTRPAELTQEILTMPEAAQLHLFMGHVGISRRNPDYYKLLVMDYVLGTGPGFTDRLSSQLRDREGLAYTVNAAITTSAGHEPGTFTCYIGTKNDEFVRVKKELLQEVRRIRDELPSKREVSEAKDYLLGSMLLSLTTDAGIASQLLTIERHHLGLDYLDTFRKEISAVTPEDVQTVAKRYLDPEHMVLVAAGAVDREGRPLAKKPQP